MTTYNDQLAVLEVSLEARVLVLGVDLLLVLHQLVALQVECALQNEPALSAESCARWCRLSQDCGHHAHLQLAAIGGGLLELLAEVELDRERLNISDKNVSKARLSSTLKVDVEVIFQCWPLTSMSSTGFTAPPI